MHADNEAPVTRVSGLRFAPFPLDGPLFDQAVSIYTTAFNEPPYTSTPSRDIVTVLRVNHGGKPGLARLLALVHDEPVAMGYGFHVPDDDWWAGHVRRSVSPETRAAWLGDAFSVVELAVLPEWRNRGIGGALLERLLQDRPERTAVLSTRTDASSHRLYRRHGFEVLTEMRFDEGGPWFYVMGRRLRAEERTP